MNFSEIKDLMAQFDHSSLREFSFKQDGNELYFSKNERREIPVSNATPAVTNPVEPVTEIEKTKDSISHLDSPEVSTIEGEIIESPLVGVAYLSPAPEKPAFVSVGDAVKKGQTLLIIEAMKVMNEIPAPRDGVVTEILVSNEAVVEYGQGLVRLK